MAKNDIGGVWRTVGGRRIFIKDGEDLASAMKRSGKFKNTNKSKKTEKEDKVPENYYEGTQRWGFGYANDDNIPVYENKIDYSGDFSHADLSKVSDEDLTKICNKQSELYNEALNRQVGDRRTYNGRKDEIFKRTDTLRYENGLSKVNEEMQKRDLPRYNIYNKENGMIMVSSPTQEMAERQLKDMYETDKSLQKSYGWEKLPEYEIKKGKVDEYLNERKDSKENNYSGYETYLRDRYGTENEDIVSAGYKNKKDLYQEYKDEVIRNINNKRMEKGTTNINNAYKKAFEEYKRKHPNTKLNLQKFIEMSEE